MISFDDESSYSIILYTPEKLSVATIYNIKSFVHEIVYLPKPITHIYYRTVCCCCCSVARRVCDAPIIYIIIY